MIETAPATNRSHSLLSQIVVGKSTCSEFSMHEKFIKYNTAIYVEKIRYACNRVICTTTSNNFYNCIRSRQNGGVRVWEIEHR